MKTDKYKYTAAVIKGEHDNGLYEEGNLPNDDVMVIVSNSLAGLRGFINGMEHIDMFVLNITKTDQGKAVIKIARENDSAKKL